MLPVHKWPEFHIDLTVPVALLSFAQLRCPGRGRHRGLCPATTTQGPASEIGCSTTDSKLDCQVGRRIVLQVDCRLLPLHLDRTVAIVAIDSSGPTPSMKIISLAFCVGWKGNMSCSRNNWVGRRVLAEVAGIFHEAFGRYLQLFPFLHPHTPLHPPDLLRGTLHMPGRPLCKASTWRRRGLVIQKFGARWRPAVVSGHN